MYNFLARKIHEGMLTWEEVAKFDGHDQKMIREAYHKRYPDEEIPNEAN